MYCPWLGDHCVANVQPCWRGAAQPAPVLRLHPVTRGPPAVGASASKPALHWLPDIFTTCTALAAGSFSPHRLAACPPSCTSLSTHTIPRLPAPGVQAVWRPARLHDQHRGGRDGRGPCLHAAALLAACAAGAAAGALLLGCWQCRACCCGCSLVMIWTMQQLLLQRCCCSAAAHDAAMAVLPAASTCCCAWWARPARGDFAAAAAPTWLPHCRFGCLGRRQWTCAWCWPAGGQPADCWAPPH